MIIFWTNAQPQKLKKTIGAAISRAQVPHKFCPLEKTPVPEAGDILVAMGDEAFKKLQAQGVFPKNRSLSSTRNSFTEVSGVNYTAMYDVGIVDVDPGKLPELIWDVQLIARKFKTGTTEVIPSPGYRWVPDFSELVEQVKSQFEKTGKPLRLSFDTETVGLTPFVANPQIVVVQISIAKGTGDCVYVSECADLMKVRAQITWLLSTPMVKTTGANLKYDFVWIKEVWGIECSNFSLDTLLIGSLLDENRSNSLNMHTKIYGPDTLAGYDDKLNNSYDKSRMDLVPKDDMLPYAAGDVDAVLNITEPMLQELNKSPSLINLYLNILHPAARAFEDIEHTGLLVSRERYAILKSDLETAIESLEARAIALMPYRLRLKYADNLSLGRPALLKDYFFTPMGLNLKPLMVTAKSQEPSTAKNHLEMFGGVPEAAAFCTILDELNQAKKTLSTYVDGFLKHLRIDSRFHAAYLLHSGKVYDGDDDGDDGGTTTGRLSARDPAVQTIPKKSRWAKRIRECFVAPDGYVIQASDYAQGELKLAACVGEEPTMIQTYLDGIDLHVKTGAGLAKLDLDEFMKMKETNPDEFGLIRTKAKPANFGIIYGISPEGYMAYAWNGYRQRMTINEATETVGTFFRTYPELLNWHKRYKAMCHRDGYVTSPLGRIRHLPHIKSPIGAIRSKAERQAVNSPIQSTLSDLMIWSISEIKKNYPWIKMSAMVHDQLISYVPEDKAVDAGKRVTAVMSDLPIEKTFGWKPQLVFTADAEAGPDLAHLTQLDLSA